MYTKGKWEASKSPLGDWIVSTDDILICRVDWYFNANLISAAPEMYEALKAILANCELIGNEYRPTLSIESTMELYDAIERAEQAIAKAEGKK